MTSGVDAYWRSRIRFREDISPESSLEELLAKFTKRELEDIGRNLRLSGLSKLRKAELMEAIIENLGSKVTKVFQLFDTDRYELVKRMTKQGNMILAKHVTGQKIRYFLDRGIGFPIIYEGQEILFLPEVVSKAFQRIDGRKYRQLVKENDELVLLTHGMLHYYGVLAKEDFRRLLREHLGDKGTAIQSYLVIYESMTYYQRVLADFDYFIDMEVDDEEEVMQEHLVRSELGYYPFTKQQLIKAGQEGYVEKTKEIVELMAFIGQHTDIPQADLDAFIRELVLLCKVDTNMFEVVNFVTSKFNLSSMEAMQHLVSLVTEIINATRKWILKGHTSQELFSEEKRHLRPLPGNSSPAQGEESNLIDLRTGKRIGRSDPCPCGSGKKFRMCCGR